MKRVRILLAYIDKHGGEPLDNPNWLKVVSNMKTVDQLVEEIEKEPNAKPHVLALRVLNRK